MKRCVFATRFGSNSRWSMIGRQALVRLFAGFMAAASVIGIPETALAQSVPLSQILTKVLVDGVTMPSTTGTVVGNPHEAHFIAALGQDLAPFEINKALVGQLGTFPIGSSSGGFVFNFDPASGLFTPASQSFGPGFAERALTNGKGRFGFGLNYQRLEFSSFEGVDLHNNALSFVLQHNDCCLVAGNPLPDPDDPFFEGDLVRLAFSLSVKTDVFAPFVSYGLNNRWDVGVVVPIVRVELNPTITSTIDRISTCPNPPLPGSGCNVFIHNFDGNGSAQKVTPLSGTAKGIGDIVLRTKYRFYDEGRGGLAGAVDLRLPTGDKENLLGTGAVQTKLSAIGSAEFGRVAPHVNLGYTISSGDLSSSLTTLAVPTGTPIGGPNTVTQLNGVQPVSSIDLKLPNEINYILGVDVAAHPLVTVSADVIGRNFHATRFSTISQDYRYRVANNGTFFTTSRDTFDSTGEDRLNLLLGVVGAKFNIPGTPLLLTANVLFPLNDSGLKPKVTPVVGIDYSFKK